MLLRLASLCCLLILAWAAAAKASEPPRPNILVFYVDDMGWGAIGPNGQAQRMAENLAYVRTPNLDRLAAEGVNFPRGYGCTVCSPARSSLQTGFHQGHTFADRNDPDNAKKAIRADDPSIGKSLAAAGYATGYWGKWGYGGSQSLNQPTLENLQTLPTSHGYQYVLAELHHVRAHTFFQPTLWSAPPRQAVPGGLELMPNSMRRYQNRPDWPRTPALQDHPDYPSIAYCDDSYAFAALEFVRRQSQEYRQTGKPFHALLAVQIPHAPFAEIATLPEWDAAYADDAKFRTLDAQSRQWAAMVTRIDAHFGNILDALEDPNQDGDTSDSIAENTLVLFESDNGGPSGASHRELNTNGGLRGTKGTIHEGGIRVPLIMRWPAKINAESKLKPGTSSQRVVDVTDLLPTFCELAGAPVPVGIDGVSLAPTLTGQGYQRQRDFIIHEAGNQSSIIRGNLKLIHANRNTASKLYDLAADPTESQDIAAEHPELVQELETLLLGERVTEPKGFANTYHAWTGADGASTADPNNWSDYVYSNAGVTYQSDRGRPQLSWIAYMHNSSDQSKTAMVTSDLECLGLEIHGNANQAAWQILKLKSNVKVVGRNEIRIGDHGRIELDNSSLQSLRWIDVQAGGSLTGHGNLDATVFNSGSLSNRGTANALLAVDGDYHQTADGRAQLMISGAAQAALKIRGIARLAGKLEISIAEGFTLERDRSYAILSAEAIEGRFAGPAGEVVTASGERLKILYGSTEIRVSLQ